jgi:ribosomal protein S12 methylthiotransferase accessory factor YcaO
MGAIDDLSAEVTDVERCERFVLQRLQALGFDRAYRVALTSPADDLQVVRAIVPRMEVFNDAVSRLGVRLRDHARACA